MKQETLEWIDACLDGQISPEDFRKLQQTLRDDPVALEHWCRQAEIHGRLEWELGAGAMATQAPARAARPGKARRWLAAAALLTIGAGIGILTTRTQPGKPAALVRLTPSQAAGMESVARITSSEDARWNGPAPHTGSWISAGLLDLAAGRIVVTFDSGASVQLNGPSRLHLSTPNHTLLESGSAVVHIPRQAYGFVFETPSTQISRRMSRFAVSVDTDGQSEIHVLDGEIQLAGKLGDLDAMALARNNAIRISGSGEVFPDLPFNPTPGTRIAPESADLLPEWYLHWGFDSGGQTGGRFTETGKHGAPRDAFHGQVHHAHPDSSVSLVPGRFGNAVLLNGQQAFIATDFPGFSGNSPRTVAMWVKIDPQTPDTLAYSMLSWGTADNWKGGKWQLGWNTARDNTGMIGAIRTEVDGGYIVGTTDLRTGRWHHVAAVFTGGNGADVATHVRHYVDGRLEATTAVKPMAVDTLTHGDKAVPVTIGRRVEADDYYRTFRGEIDEVYLFPTALTPEQIEGLFRENLAPQLRH